MADDAEDQAVRKAMALAIEVQGEIDRILNSDPDIAVVQPFIDVNGDIGYMRIHWIDAGL